MVVSNTSDYQALRASGFINRYSNNAASSVAKLSSGVRINSGSDDPSGIVTASKLKGRAMASDAAAQNAQNAASMAKAADTAYGNALDILYRMQEIAAQGQENVLGDTDGLQAEASDLTERLKEIAKAKFGNKDLFSSHDFNLGVDAGQTLSAVFTAPAATAVTVGTTKASVISAAIETLAKAQGVAGGHANALGYIADGLTVEASSMWSGYEDFTSTNIASEMAKYVKSSVLTQSAQLILAQYNQNAYSVLNLLS